MPSPKRATRDASPKSDGDNTPAITSLDALLMLEAEQGPAEWEPRSDAVSELVFTILSQHNSDVNAFRAYDSLRDAFGDWERVAEADPDHIARVIWNGGLSRIKAPRIKAVLQDIRERRGSLDLDFLGEMPLEDAKQWLRELPGVGPKTAAIVLSFALGMPAMPVDTHIHRVSRRLGLIGPKVTADQAHDILEPSVPPERVFALHVHIIAHGRQVCRARRPMCDRCVLSERCPSAFRV